MIGRWQDAAFEQEHLLHACDGYFGELCDSYQFSAYGEQDQDGGSGRKALRFVHRELFSRADPIWVSGDAMTLWEHARDSFEPEPIHRTDLVAPSGFALLPWKTVITDINEMKVAYRAICWLPVSGGPAGRWDDDIPSQGVWYSLLSHIDDFDEVWEAGEEKDRSLRSEAQRMGWRWSLMHGSPLLFEQRTWERHANADDRAQVMTMHRHAQAFWRLMSQLVPVKERLPRQARRQRERKRLIPDVTVIHLRRVRPSGEPVEPGEGSVEWQRQWIVRGHWRNQWYPSIKEHRQIWISPYVKGPEDKPLVLSKRAYEFDR